MSPYLKIELITEAVYFNKPKKANEIHQFV